MLLEPDAQLRFTLARARCTFSSVSHHKFRPTSSSVLRDVFRPRVPLILKQLEKVHENWVKIECVGNEGAPRVACTVFPWTARYRYSGRLVSCALLRV